MSSPWDPRWGLRDVRSGRLLPLALPETVLGRDSTATVQIMHRSVSRHHCRVQVEGDRLWIRDLGSQNGTTVNGLRITEAELSSGDVIKVGPASLVVIEYEPSRFEDDVRGLSPEAIAATAPADREPEGSSAEIVFASLDDGASLQSEVWDDVHVILVDQDKRRGPSLRPEVETAAQTGFAANPPAGGPESHATMGLASTAATPTAEIDSAATTRDAWLHIPRPVIRPVAISGWKVKLAGGLLIVTARLFLWRGRAEGRIEGEAVSVLEWAAKAESELANSKPGPGAWSAFAREVTKRLTPLLDPLEKHASSRQRLAQELLFAARHCRNAFAKGEPDDPVSMESVKRFRAHLQNVRSMRTGSTRQ